MSSLAVKFHMQRSTLAMTVAFLGKPLASEENAVVIELANIDSDDPHI
jgi:hypothetical protein